MTTVRDRRVRSLSRKARLVADRRGAVAFEMVLVYPVLILSLLLPLADVAAAGFQFISAWQALRDFGQYLQYNPPPDVTNASTWTSTALAKTDANFPIAAINLLCGASNAACSAANNGTPMSYSYSTTVTLAPLVLKSVLCTSSATNPCTFTLPYSERFQ
jgi:Flp pilus assembly protein TadG